MSTSEPTEPVLKDTTDANALTERPSLTISLLHAWQNVDWRTRLPAIFTAVFINFGLPFINGAMLGFGEIFARDYIGVRWGYTQAPAHKVTQISTGNHTTTIRGDVPGAPALKTAAEAAVANI